MATKLNALGLCLAARPKSLGSGFASRPKGLSKKKKKNKLLFLSHLLLFLYWKESLLTKGCYF